VNTALAIAVRPNGQLFIKPWRSQLHSVGATTGLQRAVATGAQPTQTAINSDVYEWPFPVIEAAGNSLDVTGTGTIVVNGGLLPLQAPSTNFTATCEWHFGRGVGASERVLKTPNLKVLNPGLTAGGGSPQGSAGGAAGSAGAVGSGAGAGVPSQGSAGGAAGAGSTGSAGAAGSGAGAGVPLQGSLEVPTSTTLET